MGYRYEGLDVGGVVIVAVVVLGVVGVEYMLTGLDGYQRKMETIHLSSVFFNTFSENRSIYVSQFLCP
jgi:hypothetical protein